MSKNEHEDQFSKKLLFPALMEEKLYEALRELQKQYGCTYLSFRHELIDTGITLNFSTNPDWEHTFLSENLIEHCALVKEGRKLVHQKTNQNIIASWDLVHHNTSKERMVNDARKDFGIFHGLSLSIEENGARKLLGIATESNNTHFVRYILNEPQKLTTIVSRIRYYADMIIKQKASQ